MSTVWTPSEQERRALVEAGQAVVANLKTDKALVAWAKAEGLYVYIGRRPQFGPGGEYPWKNPYVVERHGTRSEVVAKFRTYFLGKTDLHARLDELKGKVLVCFCHPEACHGHELLTFIQNPPVAAEPEKEKPTKRRGK